MRTIKFRAWDKELKSMRYSPCPDLLLTMDGELYDEHEDVEQRNVSDIHILMQFTGLKDKNGKEIYESDFLDRNGVLYEIIWNKDFARFSTKGMIAVPPSEWYEFKIIGNIYEHSHLLSGGQQ